MRFLRRTIFLSFSLTAIAFAQETKSSSLNGEIFSDLYAPYTNVGTEKIRQFSGSLWLRGQTHFNENTKAYTELSANEFVQSVRKSGKKQTGLDLSVREVYASYSKSGFEMKAGKQIIPWGKSDGINPTDFLTAKDLTFFNPDEEKKRIGGTSLFLSLTLEKGVSPLTFTAVVTPFIAQSRLIIPPSTTNSSTFFNEAETPKRSISNTETAFKIACAKPQWDASILFFRGFEHLPYLTLDSLGGNPFNPTFNLTPRLFKERAVGGDFSLSLQDYVLRAETAYVWTENHDGTNMNIAPPHADAVFGVERPFFTDFRLQAQTYLRKFVNYRELNNAIAVQNALLHNYQDEFRSAGTLRFAYTEPSNLWDAEIFTMMYFQGQDYLLRPKGSYSFTEAFRATLGVERYFGSSSRPFGAFSTYNSVFLEAKVSF